MLTEIRTLADKWGITIKEMPEDTIYEDEDLVRAHMMAEHGAGRCPVQEFPAFATYGVLGESTGTVWLPHRNHPTWEGDPAWPVEIIILHEMAHAFAGKEEHLTIPLEQSWAIDLWGEDSEMLDHSIRYSDGAAYDDEIDEAFASFHAAGFVLNHRSH